MGKYLKISYLSISKYLRVSEFVSSQPFRSFPYPAADAFEASFP
jgi:hypothetical protein